MKIQLPIDTSAVSFIDVMPPEAVLDHQTKQHKADISGDSLHSIQLASGRGGEILSLKFLGTPPAEIRQAMPVTMRDR